MFSRGILVAPEEECILKLVVIITSRPNLYNIQFVGNEATWGGGGLEMQYGRGDYASYLLSNPTLVNVSFINNKARFGAGVVKCRRNWFQSNDVNQCQIFRKIQLVNMGAVCCMIVDRGICSTLLANVVFDGNSARSGAGALFTTLGEHVFVNTTFSQNIASEKGGGIIIDRIKESFFENVIFWGNSAPVGSQVLVEGRDGWVPTFTNSIIQGSGGSENWDDSLGIDGGNNLDLNPLFEDADNHILTLPTRQPRK